MSSIDPVQSKEIGAELNKKGIDLMDAPVSGGEPKAIRSEQFLLWSEEAKRTLISTMIY